MNLELLRGLERVCLEIGRIREELRERYARRRAIARLLRESGKRTGKNSEGGLS